jgi:hypothetical protein
MESAAVNFQQSLEMRSQQAENQADKINSKLEKDQRQLDKGSRADRTDIKKLNDLANEAGKAGIGIESIKKAGIDKDTEANFLERESQDVEKSQQEMQKNIAEAKQKRQSARFKYQSRNTLDS